MNTASIWKWWSGLINYASFYFCFGRRKGLNMKILALAILFILLFFRMKGTPSALCKTVWRKERIKSLEKKKNFFNGNPPSEEYQGSVFLAVVSIELFLAIFYIVLGSSIGTPEFIILSALQVFTCFWSFGNAIMEFKSAFSYNIDDYKFHRFRRLFYLILDYIYYPMAIYMLLK